MGPDHRGVSITERIMMTSKLDKDIDSAKAGENTKDLVKKLEGLTPEQSTT